MRKAFNLLLSFVVLAAVIACQEVNEVTEYDNWQERNEAFADSLSALAAGRVVVTAAEADAMEVGKFYAIETSASTNLLSQYIYVKKLTSNSIGDRPYYTDRAKAYYYGTLINGHKFDGNFVGYSAVEKGSLDGTTKLPTEFDTPLQVAINGSLIVGWKTALQYMREGERWMVFVPYQSAYGKSGNDNIIGYSLLCFDMILDEVTHL